MPGDELLKKAQFNATRALTIGAAPEAVWPWLAQIGFGRAGFYSYDLLDNLGRPSSDRIIPELQDLRIGDWIPMTGKPTEATAFQVEAFEPNRLLLWRKPDSTWSWKLTATGGGKTRLVTRLKCYYDWKRPASALVSLILIEVADFAMMRRALRGIKARAEATTTRADTTPDSGAAS